MGSRPRAVLASATWMSARVPYHTVVVSETCAALPRPWGRAARYSRTARATHPAAAGRALASLGLHPGRTCSSSAGWCRRRHRTGSSAPSGTPHRHGSSLIVGGEPQRRLRRRPAELARATRGALPGFVCGEDLRGSTHAAACCCRRDLEGLPLTLLEAASYGLPVISSDIPPHREVLAATPPGHRLVTAGSEDALVEGLRLVLDPARLPAERAGGVRLRAEVLRCFSWDEVAEGDRARLPGRGAPGPRASRGRRALLGEGRRARPADGTRGRQRHPDDGAGPADRLTPRLHDDVGPGRTLQEGATGADGSCGGASCGRARRPRGPAARSCRASRRRTGRGRCRRRAFTVTGEPVGLTTTRPLVNSRCARPPWRV